MKANNVVRLESLGAVDAERFISIVKRDTFDYTEWQRTLWEDRSIEEIHTLAKEYTHANHRKKL